jgi:transcriptional regulator with XRE-family HTH domain
MTFARHLKQIMTMKDMTQTQLATRSGLSKASISQLLSGKQNPTERALVMLAEALECSPEYLTPKDDQPISSEEIKVPPKNIPVEVAAKLLGKSEQFVRVALQRGLAPFGFATRITGQKYSYHISPKQLEQYQGGLPT